jgi:hypothetical protein
MKIFTKEALIQKLKEIADRGWIKNARRGNVGGIGNTLEDMLGITENNLPIPNAAEWELKSQRIGTTSLITLFHIEPSPRAIKFVPQVLLPKYGWKHQSAGKKYSSKEMSFRQTIHGLSHSDRGFKVIIDRINQKVLISFDNSRISDKHLLWLNSVNKRVGLYELDPQPYWGFDDLKHKAGTKLLNCFFVQAEVKKQGSSEYYRYSKVMMLQKFSFDNFLIQIEKGNILLDVDARTGHNHGTKFRMRQNCLPYLYEKATVIIG